jgi:hypothetical protein
MAREEARRWQRSVAAIAKADSEMESQHLATQGRPDRPALSILMRGIR